MISFDEAFYKKYTDTGLRFHLLDATGKHHLVTLENREGEPHYIFRDPEILEATDKKTSWDVHHYNVSWQKEDLSISIKFYIPELYIKDAKADALRENICTELMSTAHSIRHYYDYYKSDEQVFSVYVLKDYDVRQKEHSPVLYRFDAKGDVMRESVNHKLQGIQPSTHCNGTGTVSSETVEAWRYKRMDWKDIAVLCPEFVTIIR